MSINQNRNILLICNNKKETENFLHENCKYENIYILTDNIDIHYTYASNPRIKEVFFIHSAWSYKTVSDKERIAIEEINKLLIQGLNNDYSSFVEINRHIEGDFGETIRAALIFSQQLKNIINKKNIYETYDIRDRKKNNSDLRNKFKAIKIQRIFDNYFSNLKKMLKVIIDILANKKKFKGLSNLTNLVLLPAFSSGGGHYMTREKIALEFAKSGKVAPVIFVMGYSKPENGDCTYINLSDILSLFDHLKISVKYFKIFIKVKANIKKNLALVQEKINDDNRELTKFITKVLFIRIATHAAIDKLAAMENIYAIRLISNFNTFAANQLYRIKEKNPNVILFRNDSLARWGYYSEGDYKKFYDYQFVNSSTDKSWYSDKVDERCKIIISGNEYISSKIQKKRNFSPNANQGKLKLLYATGGITSGVYSKEELYNNLNFLKSLTELNYEILIKPHPAEDVDLIKEIIEAQEDYYLNNLRVLPKHIDIEEFFEESDLFVTKLSTSLWKAAANGLPVITISNTHDLQEEKYEGLSCDFLSYHEFYAFLSRVSDYKLFLVWREEAIRRQDNYFIENNVINNTPPIRAVLDQLLANID